MTRARTTIALAGLVAAFAAAVDDPLPGSSTSTASPAPRVDVDRREDATGLDPDLAAALRRAAAHAAAAGVRLVVVSGRRSPEHQQRLLDEAVAEYGSVEEAARWVATPERSAHVSGDAVDLEEAGAAWLSRHGAAYGLCQIYANEPWHFELRAGAAERGCPPAYPDPTHDPRMR